MQRRVIYTVPKTFDKQAALGDSYFPNTTSKYWSENYCPTLEKEGQRMFSKTKSTVIIVLVMLALAG